MVKNRQVYEKLQGTGNDAIWVKMPWAEHAFDAVFNGVSNQLALYTRSTVPNYPTVRLPVFPYSDTQGR
ncbi:hypothetical protein [Floridanema aerugineum]|uniref:Uncharacterized protein n=1 Tax=Floridaenema aerugineum BLCC-F46 TaxID=3153654 RepID=A0ABV4XFV6_9CYAN